MHPGPFFHRRNVQEGLRCKVLVFVVQRLDIAEVTDGEQCI